MPRYAKKKIELSRDTVVGLLEEHYKQYCEVRAKAIRIGNRIERDMKDNTDISILAKHIIDAARIESNAIDKKIEIAKIIENIIEFDIENKISSEEEEFSEDELPESVKNQINDMLEQQRKNNLKK